MPLNIAEIDRRIDGTLRANERTEQIVVALAVAVFVLGVGLLGFAYWHRNPYIAGGTTVLQDFLYWPIREIRQIRRENVALRATPALISALSPAAAGREIVKLLKFIRTGKA